VALVTLDSLGPGAGWRFAGERRLAPSARYEAILNVLVLVESSLKTRLAAAARSVTGVPRGRKAISTAMGTSMGVLACEFNIATAVVHPPRTASSHPDSRGLGSRVGGDAALTFCDLTARANPSVHTRLSGHLAWVVGDHTRRHHPVRQRPRNPSSLISPVIKWAPSPYLIVLVGPTRWNIGCKTPKRSCVCRFRVAPESRAHHPSKPAPSHPCVGVAGRARWRGCWIGRPCWRRVAVVFARNDARLAIVDPGLYSGCTTGPSQMIGVPALISAPLPAGKFAHPASSASHYGFRASGRFVLVAPVRTGRGRADSWMRCCDALFRLPISLTAVDSTGSTAVALIDTTIANPKHFTVCQRRENEMKAVAPSPGSRYYITWAPP